MILQTEIIFPGQTADNGFAAMEAAFAIVLGIVLVFEVPDRFFERKDEKSGI